MHNRRKADRATGEEEAAQRAKASAYASLLQNCMQRKATKDYSEESYELVGKVLRVNPDFYSLWNFRKELLHALHETMFQQAHMPTQQRIPASVGAVVRDDELSLTVDCIRKNPKSYGAWYHRQWVLMHFEADIPQEFSLCAQFLTMDERNFHCWNYRRWVAEVFVADEGMRVRQELEFSTEKINQNFSNYSAFHHRSCYIQRSPQNPELLLKQEFELVQNALFTEPDDQSAWWYYSFLTDWAIRHAEGRDDAWLEALVDEQIDVLQSLVEIEDTCKWPRTTLVKLLEVKSRASNGPAREQRQALLHDLSALDPAHQQRYKYLLEGSVA